MAVSIQGTQITPERIDAQAENGDWLMGADLANIPDGTPIKGHRRTFSLLAGRIYVYVTTFLDKSTGNQSTRISSGTVVPAPVEITQNNTVGLVDSPLDVQLWDISP